MFPAEHISIWKEEFSVVLILESAVPRHVKIVAVADVKS
jgi:hypothetical protein